MSNLNDKQKLFCKHYLKSFNATKAYQKAYGVSYEQAMSNGSRLMRNDSVREEIRRLKDAQAQALQLDSQVILQRYIDIAMADIEDFVEEVNGEYVLKPLEQIDTTLITEISNGPTGVKFKLADKMQALKFLREYMGLSELHRLKVEEQVMKNQMLKREQGGMERKSDVFDDMTVEQLEAYLEKLN